METYGTCRTHIGGSSSLASADARRALPGQLIVNGIIGLVLLFLTNLLLADDIPINVLTILICAIGGVVGWLIILVLHILGVAFYAPA